jgi:hypothetical protein
MSLKLFDIWKGPWRVLAHCRAPRHNTAHAASGKGEAPRCVCPHAVALHLAAHPEAYPRIGVPYAIRDSCEALAHNTLAAAKHNPLRCWCFGARKALAEYRRRSEHNRYRSGKKKAGLIKAVKPVLISIPAPDWRRGLCRTERGQAIADGGFAEGVSVQSFVARDWAKAQCEECPLLLVCDAWVTKQEKPAGSWLGVWGGKDPFDRKGKPLDRELMANYSERKSTDV